MNKVVYWIVYSWMYLHALLPFRILYVLSDILYFIVYKIVRYRVSVVKINLKNSFPDKTEKERNVIERKFYKHFCDYLVETIKLLHISDKQITQRMKFENVELVKELMKDGNSGLMFLGHYGNWEWVTSLTLHFKDGEKLGQIYRPLRNKAFDDIFLKLRKRFGSIGIAKEDTLRAILRLKGQNEQTLIGFMADQTPSLFNIHYWTTFLNQETAVFTGVERIAKKTGFSVTYLDIRKVKRGHYVGTVKLISANPVDEPKFSITEKYMCEIEQTILREPAYWLWTHKRWKRIRSEVEAEFEKRNIHKHV